MKHFLLILLGAAILAGCTVGPNYKHPKIATPPSYSQTNAAAASSTNQPESLARWWTVFHDPELESLVQRALQNNRDLRQAASRVRQARAQRGVVASGLLPEIDATGGFDHARGSKNVNIPSAAFGAGGGGGGAQKAVAHSPRQRTDATTTSARTPSATPPGGPQSPFGLGGFPGSETDIYQMGLQTSWEIDIFGGVRRSIEAAWANIAATEEGRRAILIGLLAEVATNYVELRSVQNQLQIARGMLQSQQDTLAIINARFTNGLSTELDFQQQTFEAATTTASIAPLEMREREIMHALAYLVAVDPGALDGELAGPRDLAEAPLPPLGLPSDLLRRRPDVRQAERALAAATAQIGAATADLFPKFSLTAMAGLDSSRAENIMDWSSRYFAFSPGVSWPILDWGRIHSNIKVQNELQAQALLAYENTVARALRDVEDALVRYDRELAHRQALGAAAHAGELALRLARARYERGLSDFLNVLTAQRSLLAAQDSLAQSDAAIRSDVVKLYVALGGGWEP
ncbi:MAG TPA: TolC family protein [Verrucomicrobiae bacterium]|jgi:NodT family efflux transporter outer membrane factor (OMF) lipoprotein|nr:TolC family protein [Verrucomicrobiae bacterium]